MKCEFAVKETNWLGYWLTPTGLKPWKKKVDAIIKMERPKRVKDMRMFIGAVNYYKDMWPSRAHILKPLTDKAGNTQPTSRREFVWTDEMDKAFKRMKALLVADVLTAYPDHNKPFTIYTDASDYQLGAVILQEGRPVAYYSKKLTGAQQNYTTMEKEMLSIVMTLKEFRTMLFGAKLHIHTDHRNLTFKDLNTQRVQRWRVYVEEYSPKIYYVPGEKNILADTFSRLHRSDGTGEATPIELTNTYFVEQDEFHSTLDDDELLDCFLSLPVMSEPAENPLNYKHISNSQKTCADLAKAREKHPERYLDKMMEDNVKVVCHVKPGDDPGTQWKIALPTAMIEPTISWFHNVLGHPGTGRMRDFMTTRYYHRDM